ncbi:MAG TPA: hypothetical protein VMB73_30765 [Acetobacteraceae bacterium]|nr:hypothetical protein [Acetobacteraceae bacterium]
MTPGQERLVRIAIVAVAVAAACLGFFMGFVQLPRSDLAPEYGVICGIGSAVAWAVGSTFGNSFLGLGSPANPGATLNNWFNLFAAAFAALSLGYLTPATAICDTAAGTAKGYATGQSFVFASMCRLRPRHATDLDVAAEISSLSSRVEVLRREVAEQARHTNVILDMIRDQHAAETQAVADLHSRVDLLQRAISRQGNPTQP